jgi:hypothetical protein
MIDPNAYVAAKIAGTSVLTSSGNGQVSVTIPQFSPTTGQPIAPLVQTSSLATIQAQLQVAQNNLQEAENNLVIIQQEVTSLQTLANDVQTALSANPVSPPQASITNSSA